MDVQDGAGRVTGLVQLNTPVLGKDSQLWKERLTTGTMDVIKLENKATGQCLADADARGPFDGGEQATIRPCSDETTLWRKIVVGPDMVVLKSPNRRPPPVWWAPGSGYHACQTADPPDRVMLLGCDDNFPPKMTWNTTAQPVGAVSSGLTDVTPSPPVTPPVQPKNCKVIGSGGNCGGISFSCDPYSAADTIFAVTGRAGVAVTGGAPDIGLIVADYTNEGTDSVAICAKRAGLALCAETIPDVKFGPRVCVNPPPVPRDCPVGYRRCQGACRPSGQCPFER